VPAQIGVELMGLEPDPDPAHEGIWVAQLRNHRTASNDTLRAKHVVLALGAGMPRRLDVPGDVRAISDRLAGAERYVGATACVIGGGVSAIEAVIAISAAKAMAQDDTAVYWSHRGERKPPVPKALEVALTEAIDGHGNVRFLPASEAREIVDRPEGKLLRLQKRRETPTGPADPTMLEFETQHVVACIGQEIDWGLIHGLGIYQVTGGPRGRKAIPLNALLESRQPNVYVIGDTLNSAYLQCDDYDGDTSAFQEVKHRGNIKASLTDGVKVAEVIAQKLEGRAEIYVELEFVGGSDQAPALGSGVPPPAGDDLSTSDFTLPPRSPAPPLAPPRAELVRLLDREVEAEQFPLFVDRETSIGRRRCDVSFADDTRMADRHATLLPDGDGYLVRDESAREGVFLHLTDGSGRAVTPGTVGRVGGQWLVFGSTAEPLLLGQYDARGHLVAQFRLREGTQILGRAAPDITLTATDMSVSRRHASIVVGGGQVYVRDLNSANGTFLKVDGVTRLTDGDVLRMGNQALRFGLVEAPVRSEVLKVATGRLQVARVAVAVSAAQGEVVVFQNRQQTCPFKPGQTICDVAEEAGVSLKADCHKGICGSDPVRILAGQEHLHPITDDERETLEDICGVDPASHRLACRARPTGPVVVDIVDQ
jgi:ferredoxin/pSer/pThr/pTyr-binding forkhead associated (FHA) protein/thioredoxin reductase